MNHNGSILQVSSVASRSHSVTCTLRSLLSLQGAGSHNGNLAQKDNLTKFDQTIKHAMDCEPLQPV